MFVFPLTFAKSCQSYRSLNLMLSFLLTMSQKVIAALSCYMVRFVAYWYVQDVSSILFFSLCVSYKVEESRDRLSFVCVFFSSNSVIKNVMFL